MMKSFTALCAALFASLFLLVPTTGASAHYRGGCGHCGPVTPITHYKIVRPNIYKTSYSDRSVYKHVQRVRRITTVTQVQPVVHLHLVTRVHHHTIYTVRNAYSSVTEHLSPIKVVTRSTQNFYDCRCGY